jgi:hypothetical protein
MKPVEFKLAVPPSPGQRFGGKFRDGKGAKIGNRMPYAGMPGTVEPLSPFGE